MCSRLVTGTRFEAVVDFPVIALPTTASTKHRSLSKCLAGGDPDHSILASLAHQVRRDVLDVALSSGGPRDEHGIIAGKSAIDDNVEA